MAYMPSNKTLQAWCGHCYLLAKGIKMKLIRTKLLLNHNHNSAVGIATASQIDFCKYTVRCLKSNNVWSWKGYKETFEMFLYSLLSLLFLPILFLTNGLILYPYWIVLHIVKVKKIVKRYGVDYLNKSAEELVKEVSEKEE